MATITDEDAFECAVLVYRKWAEAYDNLKAVKAETNDGSRDWKEFHALRLENATKEEAKWKAFSDRMKAASPRLASFAKES